jgi:hypothetical protein
MKKKEVVEWRGRSMAAFMGKLLTERSRVMTKPKDCLNLPGKPPHPALSPVAGERAGVRGQRPPEVRSSNILRMLFPANRNKAPQYDC